MLKKILVLTAVLLLSAISLGNAEEIRNKGCAYLPLAGPSGGLKGGSNQEGMVIKENTRNMGESQQLNVREQTYGNSQEKVGSQTDGYMENARQCLQTMQREQLMTEERWQELNSNLCRLKEQFRIETRAEAREQIKEIFRACYMFTKQQQKIEESLGLLRDMISLEPGNPENYQEFGSVVQKLGEINPKVFCNGSELNTDVPVVIKDGRSLVPVRAISEALGATVQWNQAEQTVYINKGDETKIQLQVNNRIALVNGEEIMLDVPAELRNSRVVVPFRFVAQSLKAVVNYYPVGQIITVNQ